MKPEEWGRVRGLLERALPLNADERTRLFESLPEAERPLVTEVERLLAVEGDCSGFLDTPHLGLHEELEARRAPLPGTQVDRRVGGFRLERVLASGGMGTVYEAIQEEPRRKVALKMMRHGLGSASAQRRFRYESELLARLRHPNIAQVYEAGVVEDPETGARTPWFALEFIEDAQPLVSWAHANGLDTPARLRLFDQVLEAVKHGHQRGVIHRDLKPGNVLVDPQGRVKVIDFGVARRVGGSVEESLELTREGELLGTLRYMSPEQFSGRQGVIDVRSDVYSLGVLLYELVCERPPYDLADLSLTEVARVVAEREPERPSRVRSALPLDLDWIIARAMAKEPERRYASAAALADDLRRLLAHEPVEASPPSRRYFIRKFVARHRILVAAGAVAVLAILVGISGLTAGLVRSVRAEEAARLDRELAVAQAARSDEMLAFLVEGLASPDPAADGRELTMVEFLERSAAGLDQRFADRPLVAAWMHQVVGRSFQGLGEVEQAWQHLAAAVTAFRELEQTTPRDLAEALGDLSEVLIDQGQFDEADECLAEALAAIEAEQHRDDPLVARLEGRRGRLLVRRGAFEQAEALLLDVIARSERLSGAERDGLLQARTHLAGLYQETGRNAEAEQVYAEVLASMQELYGPEHPHTMRVRSNLAVVLSMLGRNADAATEIAALLDTRRRLLGPEHEDTLATLNNLAALYYREGRFEEAAPLFRESLAVLEKKMAPEHPLLLVAKANLATVEITLGRTAAAESLLEDVYQRRLETLGPDNESTLKILFELGRLEYTRAEFERAGDINLEGLERTLEAHGAAHPLYTRFEIEIARCLYSQGELQASEDILMTLNDDFQSGSRPATQYDLDQLEGLLKRIESDRRKAAGGTDAGGGL